MGKIKGGTHVDYITEIIVKRLTDILKKKNKSDITIKPVHVQNHMRIFVKCLIVNQIFDYQTRENMTLQPESFDFKFVLEKDFFKEILKSGIVESLLRWAKLETQRQVNKKSDQNKSKTKDVPKCEVARKLERRTHKNIY